LQVSKILVSRGADVNARNKNNQTSLHYAARDGYASVVGFLLESGADPNVQDIQPWEVNPMTAYDYALENTFDDIAEVLAPLTTVRSNHTELAEAAERRLRDMLFNADTPLTEQEISDIYGDSPIQIVP